MVRSIRQLLHDLAASISIALLGWGLAVSGALAQIPPNLSPGAINAWQLQRFQNPEVYNPNLKPTRVRPGLQKPLLIQEPKVQAQIEQAPAKPRSWDDVIVSPEAKSSRTEPAHPVVVTPQLETGLEPLQAPTDSNGWSKVDDLR